VPGRAGGGTGHVPQLSSHPPVPTMALGGTRPQEGPWALLELGLGAGGSRLELVPALHGGEGLGAGRWQHPAAACHAPARPAEQDPAEPDGGLGSEPGDFSRLRINGFGRQTD